MKIAMVMFEELTVLDLVGFYDAVVRLKGTGFMPDLEWSLRAPGNGGAPHAVADRLGMRLQPMQSGGSLAGHDLVFVPGGMGTRTLMKDRAFLDWLGTAQDCPLKVSVCTGSLLWGALGVLRGLRATTNPSAYELLRPLCAQVLEQRIVDEGAVITGRGVSTSIDLGLHVVKRLAGPEAAARIKTQMDYPYGS